MFRFWASSEWIICQNVSFPAYSGISGWRMRSSFALWHHRGRSLPHCWTITFNHAVCQRFINLNVVDKKSHQVKSFQFARDISSILSILRHHRRQLGQLDNDLFVDLALNIFSNPALEKSMGIFGSVFSKGIREQENWLKTSVKLQFILSFSENHRIVAYWPKFR